MDDLLKKALSDSNFDKSDGLNNDKFVSIVKAVNNVNDLTASSKISINTISADYDALLVKMNNWDSHIEYHNGKTLDGVNDFDAADKISKQLDDLYNLPFFEGKILDDYTDSKSVQRKTYDVFLKDKDGNSTGLNGVVSDNMITTNAILHNLGVYSRNTIRKGSDVQGICDTIKSLNEHVQSVLPPTLLLSSYAVSDDYYAFNMGMYSAFKKHPNTIITDDVKVIMNGVDIASPGGTYTSKRRHESEFTSGLIKYEQKIASLDVATQEFWDTDITISYSDIATPSSDLHYMYWHISPEYIQWFNSGGTKIDLSSSPAGTEYFKFKKMKRKFRRLSNGKPFGQVSYTGEYLQYKDLDLVGNGVLTDTATMCSPYYYAKGIIPSDFTSTDMMIARMVNFHKDGGWTYYEFKDPDDVLSWKYISTTGRIFVKLKSGNIYDVTRDDLRTFAYAYGVLDNYVGFWRNSNPFQYSVGGVDFRLPIICKLNSSGQLIADQARMHQVSYQYVTDQNSYKNNASSIWSYKPEEDKTGNYYPITDINNEYIRVRDLDLDFNGGISASDLVSMKNTIEFYIPLASQVSPRNRGIINIV